MTRLVRRSSLRPVRASKARVAGFQPAEDAARRAATQTQRDKIVLDFEYEKIAPDGQIHRVTCALPWLPTDQDVPEECSFDDPNAGVFISTRFYARWG